jgi:hypothetical protein
MAQSVGAVKPEMRTLIIDGETSGSTAQVVA